MVSYTDQHINTVTVSKFIDEAANTNRSIWIQPFFHYCETYINSYILFTSFFNTDAKALLCLQKLNLNPNSQVLVGIPILNQNPLLSVR